MVCVANAPFRHIAQQTASFLGFLIDTKFESYDTTNDPLKHAERIAMKRKRNDKEIEDAMSLAHVGAADLSNPQHVREVCAALGKATRRMGMGWAHVLARYFLAGQQFFSGGNSISVAADKIAVGKKECLFAVVCGMANQRHTAMVALPQVIV